MKMTDQSIKNARFTTFVLFFLVIAAIVGLTIGSYQTVLNNSGQKSSSTLPSETQGQESTSVLGATDTKGIIIRSAALQQDTSYLIQIENTSTATMDFSPGLQLYAVLLDGSVLPISSLGNADPLSGGPLAPSEKASGTVYFANNDSLVALRIYSTPERTIFTDFPTK